MDEGIKKNRKAENPVELTGIKEVDIPEKAAGLPAVISSLNHVTREMPLLKGLKILNKLNKKGGIDCPGCAWPDPDDERSKLGEYCENGAKAIAEEATSKAIGKKFFTENSVSDLSQLSDFKLGKSGRITHPFYLPEGEDYYKEISWEESFNLIAKHLNKLHNPNEALFYTSGRTSNEVAFLYQLFVRIFGTNNLPDCSNMCHESSGVALSETLGIGKGSVKLEDFYETDLILIMGQNPGTNHPRMLSALEKSKKKGATIISVNPLKESGLVSFSNPQKVGGILGAATKLSDEYAQVRINGDMAFLQAMAKCVLESGKVDSSFINDKTIGYDEYVSHIRSLDFKDLSDNCGIGVEKLKQLGSIVASKKKMIVCWAMGLTQHKNAVNTIKEVVNLLLMKGSIGKPGAGTCPVRGHSNVQGDRTMGIHERPSVKLLDRLETVYNFKVPRENGYATVEAIEAMYEGKAKVFFGLGGNFISATPDTLYTAKALQNCNLTVHVSTKLNRSHLIHGKEALILPCLARTDKDIQNGKEQFVSVENSMGVVHSSQGILDPVSSVLKSEVTIVCGLAKATVGNHVVNWDYYLESYDNIRDDIEAVIPGFDNYNKRVRNPGGFYLPNGARINAYNTSSGKAHFTVSTINHHNLNDDELLMMTIRSHDQFNTTIYGLNDRYRGIKNERRVVLMNKKDIEKLGFRNGDLVDLFNYHSDIERVARKFLIVEYDIPEKCVATYFPEANVLVPIKSIADKSHTPNSKSVIIQLKPTVVA